MMRIEAEALGKWFGEKRIFRDISFSLGSPASLAITGPNGSGKTTLVRILAGLLSATEGRIRYTESGVVLERRQLYSHIGLVGPYLELYDDLTAFENLLFLAGIKKVSNGKTRAFGLLNTVGLAGREDDPLHSYSSGMRQRLKYAFALLAEPQVLILDEPTSSLDEQGIDIVYDIMEKHRKKGILIIATNDKHDLKFGEKIIAVND